ncbi:hypothetical protein BJ741DRAFT_586250 [Chytriomyces cf. hyalinus JEL632]|nr:hypothetical protein BJ741DRAFT_586250 [Chytriomyces cf. hyalinus JEL632]
MSTSQIPTTASSLAASSLAPETTTATARSSSSEIPPPPPPPTSELPSSAPPSTTSSAAATSSQRTTTYPLSITNSDTSFPPLRTSTSSTSFTVSTSSSPSAQPVDPITSAVTAATSNTAIIAVGSVFALAVIGSVVGIWVRIVVTMTLALFFLMFGVVQLFRRPNRRTKSSSAPETYADSSVSSTANLDRSHIRYAVTNADSGEERPIREQGKWRDSSYGAF